MTNRSRETPEQPNQLRESQLAAGLKLSQRIAEGEKLLERVKNPTIVTPSTLEQTKRDFDKWSAYNKELLQRLFTTAELAEEYVTRVGGGISIGEPTYGAKLERLQKDISEKIHRLESISERIGLIPVADGVNAPGPTAQTRAGSVGDEVIEQKVFIVHGHDNAAKEMTARFLEKLGLEAIVLHEQPNSGRTLIEKLEHHSAVKFAIALLTPDDLGAAKAEAANLSPRARQNVILELGYFIGKLGRGRVCALYKGPSSCRTIS
jgi:hypothetical protein